MSRPTFMSLFSGIGGFDLGLERAGWQCVAQCDNDPFCNKVLAKHWPGVTRYDDVRNVGVREPLCEERKGRAVADRAAVEGTERDGWQGRRGTVDLICGGFPCQDLSVAGKRAGLDGARSGLWFEFYRILSELRPAVALIENVPGLLSSNSGRDFGVILAGLEQLWPGRWGWAVLDSQHFGVAQRRRRLYVIAGPPRERIAQILSLCESGDWNTQASRTQGQDVAATIRGRSSSAGVNEPGRGGEDDANLVTAGALDAAMGHHGFGGQSQGAAAGHLVTHSLRADGFDASEDGTGRGTPLVPVGYTIHGTGKTARVASQTDVAGSIRTKPPGSQENSSTTVALQALGVRRLTPVECERLQGFPDGFTCICGAEDEQRNWTKTSTARIPEGTVPGMRSVSGPNRPTSRQRQHDGQQPDEHSDALRTVSREEALGRGQSISTRGMPTRQRQQDQSVGDARLQPGDASRGADEEARHRDIDALPNSETHPHVACKCADGPRYKALGNAVTVPVIEYLGRRIAEALL